MISADIFIPTSNRFDALKPCLDSLSSQTRKDFRVIIVGLSNSKKINDLIKSYKKLNIIYFIQKKKGLINAANEALEIASSEIFIRTDDDTSMTKHWFESLMDSYSDKSVGGVTGPTLMTKEGLMSRDLTRSLESFKSSKNIFKRLLSSIYIDYLYDKKIKKPSLFLKSGVFTLGSNYKTCLSIKKEIEVSNLEACNWSSRISLLKEIDGFDTIYNSGLGDYHEADAALKIKKLGYKLIFNPKAILFHRVELGKVSKARPAAFWRIQNFIIFYFRFYKIKSISQLFKFLTNVLMQNMYYLFNFFITGRLSQLFSIPGTFIAFGRVLLGVFSENKKNKFL